MSDAHHPLYKQIIGQIRSRLNEAGYTQEEIGKKLGLGQSAVSMLMSGRARLNVDQLLKLSDMVGLEPHTLIKQAEVSSSSTQPLTSKMEEVLFRSEAHVLLYSAATKEIKSTDIHLSGYGYQDILRIFEELVSVGLLKKVKSNVFVQIHPNILYTTTAKLKNDEIHRRIIERSMKRYYKLLGEKTYNSAKFNWYLVDRFSTSQIKEIESALWKFYEKVSVFQKQNLATGYITQEKMYLWNIHCMLLPALDVVDGKPI